MNLVKRLVKAGAWLTLANMVSKLASLISLPILARLLGPESLGIYSIIFSLAQSAQSFSSLGIDVAIQRNGAQHKNNGSEVTGRLFGVGLFLICLVSGMTGLGIWLFRVALAKHWLGDVTLAPWLCLAALIIVLQPYGTTPLLFLSSLQDFRAYALRSSIGMIFNCTVVVMFAYKWGIYGALLGLILANIAQIFWSYLIIKPVLQSRQISLRVDKFFSESCSILKFGFPYYFGNTLLGSLVGLPLMGLVNIYGGLEDLGYLRIAQSTTALITFIPSAIAPAAISYLSASSVDKKESHHYLKSVHLRSVWVLLLLATSVVCLILPDIINSLFGEAYQQAIILSWLSLWISLFAGITSVLIQYLLVSSKTFIIGLSSTAGVIAWVLVAFFLVPQYHALGFLLSQGIGQVIGLLIVITPAISDMSLEDKKFLQKLFYLNIFLLLWTICFSSLNLNNFVNYIIVFFTIIFSLTFLFFNVLYFDEKNKLKKIGVHLLSARNS